MNRKHIFSINRILLFSYNFHFTKISNKRYCSCSWICICTTSMFHTIQCFIWIVWYDMKIKLLFFVKSVASEIKGVSWGPAHNLWITCKIFIIISIILNMRSSYSISRIKLFPKRDQRTFMFMEVPVGPEGVCKLNQM